ncbi:hypothetical protein KP509_27G034000 [Ceratopteris richardii]|uniref:Integrase catalytic domain-containing protein n=1 Tax=Ceratopteris richardii TaxID=49495 RepID=A0A8T2RFB0_CERRI|nr:hypothetical protein KP509_27G034000 [Ceratopteris richardii]
MTISSRIAKWVLELQEYKYTFVVDESTRVTLADILTHRKWERKISNERERGATLHEEDIEDAYTILFDGAYKKQCLDIRPRYSTPYYPQCNGLVEKTNKIICKIISKQVKNHAKEWYKHLTATLWAYHRSYKSSLEFNPFHLVYGQEALLPIEVEIPSLRELVNESGKSEQEVIQKRLIDLQELKGSLVLRYDNCFDSRHDTKFQARWEVSFLIKTKFKNGSYELMDLSRKVHKTKVN